MMTFTIIQQFKSQHRSNHSKIKSLLQHRLHTYQGPIVWKRTTAQTAHLSGAHCMEEDYSTDCTPIRGPLYGRGLQHRLHTYQGPIVWKRTTAQTAHLSGAHCMEEDYSTDCTPIRGPLYGRGLQHRLHTYQGPIVWKRTTAHAQTAHLSEAHCMEEDYRTVVISITLHHYFSLLYNAKKCQFTFYRLLLIQSGN